MGRRRQRPTQHFRELRVQQSVTSMPTAQLKNSEPDMNISLVCHSWQRLGLATDKLNRRLSMGQIDRVLLDQGAKALQKRRRRLEPQVGLASQGNSQGLGGKGHG